MVASFRFGLIPTLRLIPTLASLGVGVIAGLALIGWLMNIAFMRRMAVDGAVMMPSVVILLLLSALALYVLSRSSPNSKIKRFGRLVAWFIAVVALVSLAESLAGWDGWNFDRWILSYESRLSIDGPVRMAAPTALGLLLSGVALLTLDLRTKRNRLPAQTLAFALGVLGLLALLGYSYGAGYPGSVLGWFGGPAMAFPTSFAVLFLSAGLLCTRPEDGMMAVVTSASAGGFLARRLLLAAVLIPATLGWLKLVGDRIGIYDDALGASLLIAAHIVLFLIVIWKNAEALHLVDLKRLQAEAALRLSRDDLEQQIIKRTGELRQSEELKRIALNALPQQIVVVDRSGRVIEVNHAWQTFVNKSSARSLGIVVGSTYIDAIKAFTSVPDHAKIAIAEGIGSLLGGSLESFTLEFRLKAAAQNSWLLLTAVPLPRESGGVVVVHTDISARKASEEATRRSAEILRQLQTVTDSALQPLSFETLSSELLLKVCQSLSADAATLLLTADDRRTLNVSASIGESDALKSGVSVKFGEGTAGLIAESRAPLLIESLKESEVATQPSTDKSGTLIGAPLLAGNRLIGVIQARRDGQSPFTTEELRLLQLAADRMAVTIERVELYKAERQSRIRAEEASRLKDEFLAVVSHELRSPLNTILGWVTLVRGGRLKESEEERALETIERSARAQDRIVGDLLDVSRIITGKLQMNIRGLDPAPVIQSAIDALRPAADGKGVILELELKEGAGTVSADADRLQQIVWNLISNAIRFTPTGGRIDIKLEPIDEDVQISVRDTGRGIRSDFLPFIFDRFSQADTSSTRRVGGLGLGLAIVRHLVELHGGEVTVESAGEGQGATFVVRLPRLASRQTSSLSGQSPFDTGERTKLDCPPPLEGLRVLIVDDEIDAVELVRTILEECHADVRTATSVEEAMIWLRTDWSPELLISDIEMPEADGYALIRHLRSIELDGAQKIPAVALTAHASVSDRMRTLDAGFQMHLPKPVEPAELLTVVASLAGRMGKWKPSSTLVGK